MVTVDLQTKSEAGFWALLCLQNGDQYDLYGDTLADIRAAAEELGEHLGVTVDTWNLELPE